MNTIFTAFITRIDHPAAFVMNNTNPEIIKTTVCIVRHGETDWNSAGRLQGREDIELNAAGRKQAYQLAAFFQQDSWDIILSSPLKRASETAKIIASSTKIAEIVFMDDLQERDYGSASGLLPEERRILFPDNVIPDQEEFENLKVRAMKALTKIADDFQGRHIIVVSHGALINSILYTLSGGKYGSFKTRLKNGCLNLLVRRGSEWFVNFYNITVEELPDKK